MADGGHVAQQIVGMKGYFLIIGRAQGVAGIGAASLKGCKACVERLFVHECACGDVLVGSIFQQPYVGVGPFGQNRFQ